MTKTTKTADLATLSLADLQARFAEVTGKTTKSRKKADLIEKITDAMESAETPQKKAPAKKKPAKVAEKAPETASDAPEGRGRGPREGVKTRRARRAGAVPRTGRTRDPLPLRGAT